MMGGRFRSLKRACTRHAESARRLRHHPQRRNRRRGLAREAGEPHAEVLALRAAGERAADATVYVNLEPCNHQGRTPPCVEALVKSKVDES